MIRLWWFCLWLWEWFWHPQGMLVWAEANQGLVSLIALISALGLFLLEQKRANEAEQRASDLAKDAEAAEEKRANRAEAAETRRANEAVEREIRLASEAEERRREGQINAELQRMAEYAGVAKSIIRDAEMALEDDRTATLSTIAQTHISSIFIPSAKVGAVARACADSLDAISQAAPLDPKLILATREAILELAKLSGASSNVTAEGVGKWFGDQIEALAGIRSKISEQEIALTARLRPSLPFAFEPPASDSPDAHRAF